MCQSDSRLLPEQINLLRTTECPIDIVVLDQVDSSNDWVMQQCRQGRSLPLVCFAEQQTAGRGRRGKQWISGHGTNITMTLAWPFEISHTDLCWLPLTIALAIVKALNVLGIGNCQIKWPNDVLVDNKKIAGILIETAGQATGQRSIVIGIGLNYDLSTIVAETPIAGMAVTDICSIKIRDRSILRSVNTTSQTVHALPTRNAVAALLLDSCLNYCHEFPVNIVVVRKEFAQKYDYCLGKQLDIMLDDGSMLTGKGQGLTDQAELMVLIANQERVFSSADVSVRTT